MMTMTIAQFAGALPLWYAKYGHWNPNLRKLTAHLECSISSKAVNVGYLDMSDLLAIADWGGNQYNIKAKIQAQNTNASIQSMTRQAIQDLNTSNWRSALQSLKRVHWWGLTYSTKTLRFIRPQDHPAFDSLLRSGIKALSLKGTDASYGRFIDLCTHIRRQAPSPGPRSDGSWWLADVEMALFAFVRNGNHLI